MQSPEPKVDQARPSPSSEKPSAQKEPPLTEAEVVAAISAALDAKLDPHQVIGGWDWRTGEDDALASAILDEAVDMRVREAVANASHLDDPESLSRLTSALSRGGPTRGLVLSALQNCILCHSFGSLPEFPEHREIAETLLPLAEDADPKIRGLAARALCSWVGTLPAVRDRLETLVLSDRDSGWHAMISLAMSGSPEADQFGLRILLDPSNSMNLRALTFSRLSSSLNGYREMNDPHGYEIYRPTLTTIAADAREDVSLRMQAIRVLSEGRDDWVRGLLLPMAKSADSGLRIAALQGMGMYLEDPGFLECVKSAAISNDADCRMYAIGALANPRPLGSPGAEAAKEAAVLEVLGKLPAGYDEAAPRTTLVGVLATCGGPASLRVLEDMQRNHADLLEGGRLQKAIDAIRKRSSP